MPMSRDNPTATDSVKLKPGLSIVVPVYNSEPILPNLIRCLEEACDKLGAYEVILVNDGSADGSWGVIRELAQRHPYVRSINLLRNYGQHNALLCGIRAASFDRIVTIDDDLQNPPDQIPVLLAKLDEGFDVVYGTPKKRQQGLWRNLASAATRLALRSSMDAHTAKHVSAYRAFRTDIRSGFADYKSPSVSIDVLLAWGTNRFSFVPVRHEPRRTGTSNYTLRKLLAHAGTMMTGFSTLPLQFASLVGFVFTLFGMAVLGYVLLTYLIYGRAVPGFAFLACLIAIFSGAQMFALGIIGEYLARMHFRAMERPAYVVAETAEVAGGSREPDGPEVSDQPSVDPPGESASSVGQKVSL